ncbi:MAG: UDP-2,3-diacylglucosamine diphosphatase LpxI [Planctomycetota bacterium]
MLRPLTILPDPPPAPAPIGLIAGGGRLPHTIARHLAAEGRPVHALGFTGHYDEDLPALCDSFQTVGLLRVGGWASKLSKLGVRHAIMVGRVDKSALMHNPKRYLHYVPDFRTAMAWYRRLRHDRRSHAILAAVAEELDRKGIALLDSTAPIPDELATAGPMTHRQPTVEQKADVEFVWPLLTELLRLDVGQSITARFRDVIGVEAVEGTDRLIERTGALCKSRGWVLCKGARVGHDRRADVPTVGPTTIERLREHGGGCLALAANDVIIVEKDRTLELADRLGVAVIGVPQAQPRAVRSVEATPAPAFADA